MFGYGNFAGYFKNIILHYYFTIYRAISSINFIVYLSKIWCLNRLKLFCVRKHQFFMVNIHNMLCAILQIEEMPLDYDVT